ncbi:MAG TPA: chloride channel protein [Verrucomicrobiales bacterium]|nr:chloride channel protein [Verrucomicrobiales bacterium]
MPLANEHTPSPAGPFRSAPLADFRTDARVLLLTLLALVAGTISSFVAQGLLWLISAITNLAFFQRWSAAPAIPAEHNLGAWVIAVPVAGALIIGLMARYGSEKIRGHGIPEALEAILLGKSRIQLKVALLKPLSSAISIGSGGPFGAEGPIIMTGGAFGSLFAQRFHLSAAERKTLLVAGAAAGMSAIFATPVAAALLAVELLLFEWKPRSFIPVAAAALVASVWRPLLMGSGPIFPVAAHDMPGGSLVGFAAILGLLTGFGSGLLTLLVYAFEDLFQKLPCHWMWWPAIGALAVGIGGWFDPRVLGVGYETIHEMLRGNFAGTAIAGFMIVKALVWSVALGSGTSGGVLAPLLLMGGALGALVSPWIPGGDAGMWALTGMTAMMAGTMRAPLTSLVFAVELTHDFRLFPVLLAASVAALAVTVLVMRRSILTEKLARRGHHITREYSIDPFEFARVGDVMDRDAATVLSSMKVTELADSIAAGDPALTKRQATLIVDNAGELLGIITRGDIVEALRRPDVESLTVGDAGTSHPAVTYPGETLHDALQKMLALDVGRLPVVDEKSRSRIAGYLGRASILSARLRWHEEENIRQRG